MRAATLAANREIVHAIFVPYLRQVEVLLQVADHAIACVTTRSQERVVIPYTIQGLPNCLLRESRFSVVLGGELVLSA